MKIAVDFDGTIVEHRFPKIGKPKTMAFEVLKALINDGHQLILWSNREGKHLEEAIQFCKDNGVEFFSVNSEFPNAGWSGSGVSRKIVADLYIDDKNIGGLPDWGEIYEIITKKEMMAISAGVQKHHHHHQKSRFSAFVHIFNVIREKTLNARKNFRM